MLRQRSELDLLRVDHTGGFRKPDRLRDVYVRFAQGDAGDAELRAIQDERVESGPTGPGPAVRHRLPTTKRLEFVRNVPLEEHQPRRLRAVALHHPARVRLLPGRRWHAVSTVGARLGGAERAA